MKRLLAVMLALVPCAPAGAAPSWDWQLSAPFDLSVGVDVLDIEPEQVTARDIAALKRRGVSTICYVSVGTLEAWRPDAADFPASVIGRSYGDWPDERFLDVRRIDVLVPLMAARFRACADLGFDAVEPDNMDAHDNASGFALTAADTLKYVRALARAAHGMGLDIGQKNVPDLTGALVGTMDFAVTESCWQDGWCNDVAAYRARGKPIFDAEYMDRPVKWPQACDAARSLGISMILKDRDLTARRKAC